ncbi:MAG: histidine kinase dimerization/phosphoacceptor domain -containing protein [Ignavibacteriaceae bacterium]
MVYNDSENAANPTFLPVNRKKEPADLCNTNFPGLNESQEKLKIFNECFFKLGSRLNYVSCEKEAAKIIADISAEIFYWETFCLYTFNIQSGNFFKIIEINRADDINGHNGAHETEFSLFDILDSGKKIFVNSKGEISYQAGAKLFSGMVIPMKMAGKSVGIITVSASEDIYSGSEAGFLEILSDYFCGTSERICLKQQLDALETQYHEIFEYATIGVFQSKEDGTIIKANPAFASMLGYSTADDVLLLNMENDIYYDKNELGRILSRHKNEGYSFIDEIKWKKKDHSSIWVRITLYSLTDKQGYEYFEGFVTPITETKIVKEKINNSQKEKEVLLKELHHRVKNNLQVISSLLNLQSSFINKKNTEELFKESKNRIKSISLIHELLYQSKDFALVDFRAYTENFIHHIAASYDVNPGKIIFRILINNVFLSMDAAIPCGLILNEVVSNSIKHAFKTSESGEICIEMNKENDKFLLKIYDNGSGIKDEEIKKEGLGIVIIRSLVQQLSGSLNFKSEKGTMFTISFKED